MSLPEGAAWRHLDARVGFEVTYFLAQEDGYRVEGCTTAVEDRLSWIVEYAIDVDAAWRTRRARVTSRSASGRRRTLIEADGDGHWWIDGAHAPDLDGCLDVDLESSAMTNTFPVHRLGLAVGADADAPAAFVRALDLGVERIDQHYTRVPGESGRLEYDYSSPVFDFHCRLVFDESGLVMDYPGLAARER
ncbi:putative glycolipid-binding domain-containing protein [Nonomuraea antimicrobica]